MLKDVERELEGLEASLLSHPPHNDGGSSSYEDGTFNRSSSYCYRMANKPAGALQTAGITITQHVPCTSSFGHVLQPARHDTRDVQRECRLFPTAREIERNVVKKSYPRIGNNICGREKQKDQRHASQKRRTMKLTAARPLFAASL